VDGESPGRNDRPVAPGQLGSDGVDRRGELDDPSCACAAKRIVLDYLAETCSAALEGRAGPSLLPSVTLATRQAA
jgi:hypothetical protein